MRRTAPADGGEPRRQVVSYRRTPWQSFGHGLLLGAAVGVLVAVIASVAVWGWRIAGQQSPHDSVLWLFAVVALAALIGAVLGVIAGVRVGVDADEIGLHGVPPSAVTRYPWPGIADIRAERRGGRSVVVVQLRDGGARRLKAPYDGRWFARDRRFENKFFVLLNQWEMHRTWHGR